MFGLDDILSGVGDVAGYFAGQGDRNSANSLLDQSRSEWNNIDPNVKAEETGPSAYNNAGTDARGAQMDVLSQLKNKYSSGGLDALDRGRLNEINASTAAAGKAAGARAADDAARRGMRNSASNLVSQQVAGQGAAQVGAQQGSEAAAQAEQARRASLNQAGYMAGQTRGQDYERAQAQDAIQRFNASQRQGAGMATSNNRFRRVAGLEGANAARAGAYRGDANATRRLGGEIGGMAGSVADYFTPGAGAAGGGGGGGGGIGGAAGMGDMLNGAAMFNDGGTVPGPDVDADVTPINATPGEVVLPKQLVEWLKGLLTKTQDPQRPPQSSPSVFDAKGAVDQHNRQLEQSLQPEHFSEPFPESGGHPNPDAASNPYGPDFRNASGNRDHGYPLPADTRPRRQFASRFPDDSKANVEDRRRGSR